MAMKKVSVTLDADLVAEIKTKIGEGEFSRFVNETLALRLQGWRLERLERELSDEYGPIPDEVQREIDSHEWPGG
jgi:Arc/MetJ-type ribon-helix-helix transcriptional regulator